MITSAKNYSKENWKKTDKEWEQGGKMEVTVCTLRWITLEIVNIINVLDKQK